MKIKLILCTFLLSLFTLMNLYSRTLRHINIDDVKQKHQQKIIEKRLKEDKRREEEKYIQSVMENKKCDWRKELNEQMTTTDVFFTTLPATGDIEVPAEPLGFNRINEFTIDGFFDTSLYDTLVLDISIFGDQNLKVFLSGSLILNASSSGIYSIKVSQSKKLTLRFQTLAQPTTGSVSVNDARFQRRTPLNVFATLDSPEATSFIRSDPNMLDLSPQERLKKLREMLDASDEYVEKILGSNFPGTGAVRPGEAGDTPGVKVSDFDVSKMEKDYGEVAGSMNTPSSAIKFMQDLMKDGFGGNEVRTNVNGQRMTGRPAEIIQQIKLNFPGGV
jgi:hypothetical protein